MVLYDIYIKEPYTVLNVLMLYFCRGFLRCKVMTQNDKVMEDSLKIEWPDDYILKSKFFRSKAQAMTHDIEVVSNSFTAGM